MCYADALGSLREAGLDKREAEAIAVSESGPPPWPIPESPEEDDDERTTSG